jgi:hypothetical protein
MDVRSLLGRLPAPAVDAGLAVALPVAIIVAISVTWTSSGESWRLVGVDVVLSAGSRAWSRLQLAMLA